MALMFLTKAADEYTRYDIMKVLNLPDGDLDSIKAYAKSILQLSKVKTQVIYNLELRNFYF